MSRKRKLSATISLFLALSMTVSAFTVSTLTVFAAEDEIEISQGLDAVPDPIDPQSWELQRDMTWNDLNPNPVINWMEELNPASLDNKFAYEGNAERNRKIVGGFLMFEYLERKFATRGEAGSDPLGFYLFNGDGSGQQTTVTKNPVLDVYELISNEKYNGDKAKVTDADFAQWWVDYLNKPQEVNHGVTIDGFWRENSYGQWGVDLKPYGPFTIPYFEFETMGYDIGSRFQTYEDVPPSFRRGTASSNYFSFDTIAQQTAVDKQVPFDDFDFFFLMHAGNAESGVWQEFGQLQFASRKDVPYELGPGPRMTQVEKFFTENPDYLELYVDRYAAYPGGATFKTNLDEYNALKEAGKAGEFEFKLAKEDWDWVNGYNDQTAKNTRYVSFTSWEAAVSEWSHAGSYTLNGRRIPRSTQGENSGMSVFAHEFGHISSIADNYGDPWSDRMSPATEPWDLMSRGSFGGPYGDHARWTVPGVEASSVSVHMLHRNKEFLNYYGENDVLTMSVEKLASGTPVVAEVVSRAIPLANEFYPWLSEYGLTSPNYYKAIKLNFGSGNWADKAALQTTGYTWTRKAASNMTVEVVDQSGYDSFIHDSGVLLSRTHTSTGNPSHAIIDSHLYDIEMVDFYLDGEPSYYPVAHATQLADATFKAGISSVDTGYYKGGVFKGDQRISDEVVSGDTVNEFFDPYNKLRFYVLDKHMTAGKYGDFLSYSIGMLHTDGKPVGGELAVTKGKLTTAIPGNVAVQEYKIKNTGDATDIVRITLGGTLGWNVTILNNLYAIDAGEEITVPVYIEVPEAVGKTVDETLTFTASSESNAAKTATVTIENVQDKTCALDLVLTANKADINAGDWFRIDAGLTKVTESNVVVLEIQFDPELMAYNGFTLPPGVTYVEHVIMSDGETISRVALTLMVQDYEMKDLVSFLFEAKATVVEDITLAEAAAKLVVRDANGDKEVVGLTSSVNTEWKWSDFDLIILSNAIDFFGSTMKSADWNDAKRFDFNNDGVINISDISHIATKVQR